jgi:peptidoglycan hydrolase-like protein with peptidoglycan-binding domain
VSSNGLVLPILDAANGEAFARDIGQADVRVTFTQPTLPNAMLEGSLSVDITEERFYGTALPDSGAFGDTVRLTATAVHTFTDSTRVSFINGAAGYVDSVGPTQLRFVVGAGNDSTAPAPLTLVNLLDENALPRGTVETKFNFKGLGGIDDAFEPNDALPLSAGLEITALPFVQLLSSDPRKMAPAPADTNFFYIDATSGTITVNIIAEWQQDANLDFFVCNGDANPPTMQVLGCARDPMLNDQDPPTVRSKEEQMSVVLGPIVHIIAFYCVDCPATVPLTYRVTIQ